MSVAPTLARVFYQFLTEHSYSRALAFPVTDSPHDPALGSAHGTSTRWNSFSSEELLRRVVYLSVAMTQGGIEAGDRIGLLQTSHPDWLVVDQAIQLAGAITVPIFNKISEESFLHEVQDSGLKWLFIGAEEDMDMARKVEDSIDRLITMGPYLDPEPFEQLLEEGRKNVVDPMVEFKKRVDAIKPQDVVTIIYTSGSTGLPKGVILTQGNLASQVEASGQRFTVEPGDLALSVLPLAHIFERMVVYFYLSKGVPVFFADDPKKAGEYLRSLRPTVMTAVPRILEKVYLKMKMGSEEKTGLGGKIARAAFSRAETAALGSAGSGLNGALYNGLVYKKFRAAMGGRLRMVISGSARLDPSIGTFFTNIGLEVYEGYGLTEASPVIAANYPSHNIPGTVGPIFPGVEVKISSDGEVLARGPGIMKGYYNRPEETAKSIDNEGWLHTGDLGSVDEAGYLTIKGRKKELFKKSTGEYVPPGPIEHDLASIAPVDTAVIVADNRTYVTALLFADPERLPQVKADLGLEAMGDQEFLDSPQFRAALEEQIREKNKHHHHCEWVEDFRIIDHVPQVESGELTPTMKVRRNTIEAMYKNLIDEMYAQPPQHHH